MIHICAACPEYLDKRGLQPGDFCMVHWATIEVELPKAGFLCEHHTH